MKISFAANYRRPFLCAIVFHFFLFVFLLIRWQFNETKMQSSDEIVQATLVSMPSPAKSSPPPAPKSLDEKILEKKPVVSQTDPLPNALSPPKKSESITPLPTPIEKEATKPFIPPPILDTQAQSEKTIALEKAKQQAKKQVEQEILFEKKRQQAQEKLQAEIEEQLKKEQQSIKKSQTPSIEQLLQQDLAKTATPSKSTLKNHISKSASVAGKIDNQELDRYKGLIISAISHRWIIPESVKQGLVCHLKVKMAPGGVVMNVKLIKPSGNAALDRSAESAVYKASPLPVPKEVALFNEFREFNLVVRPEGILAE